MDREFIINSDKNTFMNFLENDYSGKILELFNDEGIELLEKYEYKEDRINYILCYSKYCNELFQNDKFLNLFLNTEIDSYYANLHSLDKDTYNLIIKRCIELGKDISFIGNLFSYFNIDYKLDTIDNWPYSIDLLYEVFKKDLYDLGPRIMKKHNIDLMSHGINIRKVFITGSSLAAANIKNINLKNEEIETLYIPSDKITKELLEMLWEKNNVINYRCLVNIASYCTDITKLNKYAKTREDEIINGCKENGLIEKVNEICELKIKLSDLDIEDKEYRATRIKIVDLVSSSGLYELDDNTINMNADEIKVYIEEKSNQLLSNYIIDYHFEENYYNIMYDVRELLNFYFDGNISLSEEKIELYNKISHIDELPIEDKKELHAELKKHNMIEMFYDDMSFARNIVKDAIKNYSLTKEEMLEYRDDKLSEEYGVDVYNIKNNPFFAVVKTGRRVGNKLPEGHSYSLVGNGCLGVFGLASNGDTFVYDADNLNSEQIVHVYPMDSYTLYSPFSHNDEATSRVQTLMMPDKLLMETRSYNEILLLEKGLEATDIDNKIPELKRMALYCIDAIKKSDVEIAKANGVGIFLVNSENYHKGYGNRDNNRDYLHYDYFEGSNRLAKYPKYR